MTIDIYTQLADKNKLHLLQTDGQYLLHVNMLEKTFILFKLLDFYVELRLDPALCEIEAIRAFNDASALTPYLDILQKSYQ